MGISVKEQYVTVEGTVDDIIFQNPDNGYTICDVKSKEEGLFTGVGYLPCVSPGETVKLTGVWGKHPDYGEQFKVAYYETVLPTDTDAVLMYLSSGIISGIRAATAEKLVERFGKETLDVIEKEPEKLTQVKGITQSKAHKISESYKEMRCVSGIVMFLQKYGISANMAVKVHDNLGVNAVKLIEENPYVLSDRVEGISFKTADNIAFMRGISKNNPERIRSGLKYILQTAAYVSGHTYLPERILKEDAQYNLKLEDDDVQNGLSSLMLEKDVFADTVEGENAYYLESMYSSEFYTARRLVSLANQEQKFVMGDDELEELISRIEQEKSIELAPEQHLAVYTAAKHGCIVLTGGPGTGKTTTINAIIAMMEELKLTIALAAPTGRAAKRMSEVTGMEAKTLHRLLECRMDSGHQAFDRNEDNPLKADVVIIDEMSMVDQLLMSALLKAVKPGARVIMSGDADQLPSVGAGNVLRDIISAKAVPVIRLERIFRQAEESLIVVNAHRINKGEMPELGARNKDFFFMSRESADDVAQTVAQLYTQRLPKTYDVDPVSSIQVLSPTKKGSAGTVSLNKRLQRLVNPPDPMKSEYAYGDMTFRTGDKVMQIKNNYDMPYTRPNGDMGQGIFNGDMGIIKQVLSKDKMMIIVFDEDKEVEYPFSNLDELDLSYAVTVHKSQGSEFPMVIIPVCAFSPMLMCRNLLYTAVTRAREMVILVGHPKAVYHMVNNNTERERYTGLRERIDFLKKAEETDELSKEQK